MNTFLKLYVLVCVIFCFCFASIHGSDPLEQAKNIEQLGDNLGNHPFHNEYDTQNLEHDLHEEPLDMKQISHESHLLQDFHKQQLHGIANQHNLHNNNNHNNHKKVSKSPVIINNDHGHGESIVVKTDNHDMHTPIIINHGKYHRHGHAIIIHDRKCGSPTRIKEARHGLFGLFYKSHIIIIGKDCNQGKIVPVFAPIHDLHDYHNSHPFEFPHNDIEWPEDINDHRLSNWPAIKDEGNEAARVKYAAVEQKDDPIEHNSNTRNEQYVKQHDTNGRKQMQSSSEWRPIHWN